MLIVVILIVVIVVVLIAVNGGTNVSYRASIISMQPTNSAEVNVSVQVTNTGSDSGTPACTVSVKSPGGAYLGEAVLTAHLSPCLRAVRRLYRRTHYRDQSGRSPCHARCLEFELRRRRASGPLASGRNLRYPPSPRQLVGVPLASPDLRLALEGISHRPTHSTGWMQCVHVADWVLIDEPPTAALLSE